MKQAHDAAQSASSLEDFTSVLRVCGEATKANPTEQQKAYIHQLAGWTYNKRGETLVKLAEDTAATDQKRATEYEQAAMQDFGLSIQFDQSAWKPRFNHAVSIAMAGQYKAALEDLDFVIRQQPKHKNALFNRAEILLQLGDYERAATDYTSTLALDKSDAAAYAGRGIALSALGETREAMLDLNSVVRLDNENPQAYVDRADLHSAIGNWEMAAADYRVAIGLDNKLGRAYQNVAWMMATCPDERFRNPKLSLRAAKKALDLDGETHMGLDTYAAALAATGQFEPAAKIQRQAIAITPEEELADFQNRLALYKQGRPYLARIDSKVELANATEDQVQR